MARPFADWCQLAMDPEGFVLAAFPWDQPGGVLQDRTLERWQQEFLRSVGKGLLTPEQAIRQASVSGNGVGKSTLVVWSPPIPKHNSRPRPGRSSANGFSCSRATRV